MESRSQVGPGKYVILARSENAYKNYKKCDERTQIEENRIINDKLTASYTREKSNIAFVETSKNQQHKKMS